MGAYYLFCNVALLVFVRISRGEHECPPWFNKVSETSTDFPQCVCSSAVKSIIYCNQKERTSYVKVGHCTYQYLNQTVAANCPYVFPHRLIHAGFIRLPQNLSDLNSFTCGHLHREQGTLFCGGCTNGTGPSIYSFGSQCASCNMLNLLYYILLQYVPITIIFIGILWSRYGIVSPPMAYFVLYCNIIQVVLKTNLGQYCVFAGTHTLAIKLLLTVNSLWTLDPFIFLSPPLCISERVHEINIPIFDTLSALYPFILLLVTYISIELYAKDCKLIVFLWKMSRCRVFLNSWNYNKSLIHAFATLFFLSFVKFFSIVTDSMILTTVYSMNGELHKTVSALDPTVVPFSRGHLPVVFLSTVIFFFILLPPILLLVFYPTACFRRLSKCLKPRWALAIKIFTDVFYGSFKSGLNGTIDYRSFAGIVFVAWVAFGALTMAVYGVFSPHLSWCVMFFPVSLSMAIACVVIEPHKERAANISGTLLLLNLSSAAALAAVLDDYSYSQTMAVALITVILVPHGVLYTYGTIRLIKWLKQRANAIYRGPQLLCYLSHDRERDLLLDN